VTRGALPPLGHGDGWMIDFTRLKGAVRPVFVAAVIDACSRNVLAIGFLRGEPTSRFAVRLLRRAMTRYGSPTWLVTDKDRAFRNKLVSALLRRHGIGRRHGAVGRKGSIAIIERTWRNMKQEYVRRLFPCRRKAALEKRLNRWRRWHHGERPHQSLGQQTPDDVYRGRPSKRKRNLTAGALSVRFLDGDRRLPILRPRNAA
jgi:putative transposase